MSEWRPIETAPKDGSALILFDPETEAPQMWVASWCEFEGDPDGDGYWVDFSAALAEINGATHWMPLPEPPVTP